MRMQASGALAIAALTALSLSAVAASVVTVTQKGRAFGTSNLEVQRGNTLEFDNEDKFIHQIYVDAPDFTYESNEQLPGSTVEVTFPKTGSFEVRCHIHPKMLLRVEVH